VAIPRDCFFVSFLAMTQNMDTRQEQLLKLVIENHIEKAEPVGSKFLVNAKKLDWSEATVRNDLRALEEEGYLSHPHTSAGRVPTEKGYKFFVDGLDLKNVKISKKDCAALGECNSDANDVEDCLIYSINLNLKI
jgi:heat-inducible transcriptional repressor